MSEEILKQRYFVSVTPFTKFIRSIYNYKKDSLTWNLSLPYRIGINGTIKESSKSKVLDDIRNSYGIDLTSGIKLEKDALAKEKERLKQKIKELKERAEKSPKNSDIKVDLLKYKKKLSKIINSNDTYNNYCLRKKKFNYNKLEKLVASFLLVTGQIEYDKDKNEFIFGLDTKARFNEVNDFKSFNVLEKFNQRIFERTYYVKADNFNFIKKAEWSFLEFMQKTENPFEESCVTFNNMYKNIINKKIQKLYPLIKSKDAKEILKSLYVFRVNLENSKIEEEEKTNKDNFNSFSDLLQKTSKLPTAYERKKEKKNLVNAFIQCFPKARLKKKNVSCFLDGLLNFLNAQYITREEVKQDYIKRDEVERDYVKKIDIEKEYIKKSDVEKNYIKKSEVEKNYISRKEVERDYIKRTEIEKEYIKKSEVERDYIKKSEVEKNYVTREEYEKLKRVIESFGIDLNKVK